MRPLTLFICLLLSIRASAQGGYSCRVYYYDDKHPGHKKLYTIKQFNRFGKVVSEESYVNYFLDDAPQTVDTCSATVHYFYQNDTLLVKRVENIPGINECTINSYAYDANGHLASDTESHSYNSHRFDLSAPDSIRTWTTINVYSYDDRGKLKEQTIYEDTIKVSSQKYFYDFAGHLLKQESESRRLMRLSEVELGKWKSSSSRYIYDAHGRLSEKQIWGETRSQHGKKEDWGMVGQYFYYSSAGAEVEDANWPEPDDMFDREVTRKYNCNTGKTVISTKIRSFRFTNGSWSDQTTTTKYAFFPDQRVVEEINEGVSSFIYEYY